MQQQGKSRKPLIIGVVAAVAILAVVLVLLLTQCTGGGAGATSTPSTVGATEPVPTYELYWNADRAEYDGKSEAGMSSRMPESDGYFHVRFIHDGEEVVLKVADRKLINAIDIKDLMGLEFDENGIVIGVTDIEDMPLEKLGWQFYVQSAAKTLIKLNSSESMNGMEVLLETDENTGVYDMTGKSGPIGNVDEPISMDRVYAVANLAGEVTHVFIYQRPNYMLTHEAECQHCKKVVTWYEWTKEDQMPLTTGHYQLMNDIQLKGQPAQQEDAKVCIDLNGKRVDGAKNSRCYAMFNAGTELAIMDTSEGQTGVMAAHGKGDQGMVVWVRYGAFYLYGGTLDASDATTKLSGTAIECGKGKYVYMYGGTIIGGTAEPQKNDAGNWTAGLGGTISLGGKFVMNGGEIRDGYAKAHVEWKNGNPTYYRGIAGNIYMSSSAVFELNDGEIRNGKAGNIGGNIYMEGAAEFIMNGGKITGGYINGKGKNGGNVFIAGQKTVFTMNGGYIQNGQCRNCGANVYLNGTFNMNGGVISGGRIRDFKTGKVQENAASANVFNVNGQFFMRGGKVAGYFQAIDTDAKKVTTRVHLAGLSVIDGGENCTRNLVLSSDGGGIKVTVSTLHEKARIGVYTTTGYFTEPTKEANKAMFFSDIDGADILYHDGRLALGRMQCVCGSNSDNVEEHLGACKAAGGEKLVFAPWPSAGTMPNVQGNYYLLADTVSVGNTSIVTPGDGKGKDVVVNVDLNGKQVISKSGRFYSLFENKVAQDKDGNYLGNIADEHIELSLSDSVGTAKVTLNARTYSDMGFLVWGRYADSIITIYGGEYDGSALSTASHDGGVINTSGELNMYGGTITGGFSNYGGAIALVSSKGVFNMYGGAIKDGNSKGGGGNVHIKAGVMNMYGGTIENGSCNADGTTVGDLAYGGNMYVGGTFNMYGGTITDGFVRPGVKGTNASGASVSGGGGLGGNLCIGGTVNLYGGVIKDGNADMGGNIGTNGTGATITMDGVQVLDGYAVQNGGNFAINVRGNNGTVIKGETLISGGEAGNNGGNCYVNQWTGSKAANITMDGGIVRDGFATQKGGNFYFGGTANTNTLTINGGQILNGNTKDCGGNIHIAGNKNFLVVNGGEILGGTGNNGANNPSNNVYSVNGNVDITGGKIQGLAVCNTVANGCTTKISGNPVIDPAASGAGITMSVWPTNATFDRPYIELGTLTEGADIAIGTWGYVSTETAEANLQYLRASHDEVGVHYVDNRVFLGDVACICGGTSNIGPCAEGGHKKVTWLPLESQSINANGNYFLIKDITVSNQIVMGKEGKPSNVSVNLNGHTMTTGFRVFQVWSDITSTLNVADHKGGGAILTRGNTGDNFGGIHMLGKTSTVNFYSGKIGFAEGYKNHMEIALIEAAGTFNMYGGEISGGVNPTGTLVRVGGTFNMYDGIVRDGNNTTITAGSAARGGNFRVSGTLNVYGGTITGGKALFGGNIANTGKVNILGGTVADGIAQASDAEYTKGGNIFLVGSGAKLVVSGKDTLISGGTMIASASKGWMPGGSIYGDGGATITIEGGATVIGGDGQDGNNIYITSDSTKVFLKDCTIKNTVDGSGNIMVERGTVTIDGAQIINTANGYNLRANESGKIANFILNSGLITGGKPNVNLGGDDTFVMNGGTIENGESVNYGGNFSLTTSKFTMNDGVITGGVAAKEGGNFAISGACELIINGGEISKGTSNAGAGGNMIVWDTSSVTLNGGVISGGTCTGNGGNISLAAKTTMTINGGKVVEGESGDSAGNIAVYGKLTVNGGEILDGKCKNPGNGMNISVISTNEDTTAQRHELVITGGKIGGGVHFNNYIGNAVVSISGNPVIDKALSTKVTPTYSMRLDKNDLTIGTLTEGAKIMVSGSEGVFSYACPAGSEKYFTSEVEGLAVWQIDGELTLVHGKEASCVCGVNSDNLADHIGECDGVKHNWLPVNSLPTTSGYYYLISNVTDSGDQRIVKDTTQTLNIYLDLNGKTVTTSRWRMYRLDSSVNLTITDNSAAKTGTIKISGSSRDQGAGVWFFSGTSTFSMYGGTFDATGIKNSSADAAGMVLSGGGTFKLFAGAVKGGEVTRETNQGGSAVELSGGRIHYFGNVEITGGAGSEIYMGDNAKIDLSNVTEAPETPWNVDASGIFTQGWNRSWKIEDYFTSGSKYGAQIYLDEATGELKMGVMDCTCRQATCVGDCDGKEVFWQPVRSNSLPTANGNYFLGRDIIDAGQRNITSDTKTIVRLDLNGKSVTVNAGSRMYLLQKSNELYVTDSVGTGVINGGGHSANGGIFLPQGKSSVKIYGGNYTLRADATATPTGGWIDVSTSGVVAVHGGNFTSSINGGSLFVVRDNNTMTITGGTFKNTANSAKAQVTISVWSNATLNISGGTITTTGENQRSISTDGTVNISGGTVKGGYLTLNENGANIMINTKGTVKVSGGLVTGGNTANQGGNFVVYGKLYISGGTVKDGVSKVNAGHNIAVISPNSTTKGVLDISGGSIAGGVYFNCYYTTPTVKLSGKPTIDKALTSADAAEKPSYGMEVPGSFDLDLTGLTGGKICVKGTEPGQFAFNATEAMVDYFVSETYEGDVQLPVCYDNGGLCFGKVYCLCGASENGGTHSQGCLAVNGGKELIWLPADSAADLQAGGNFYLTKSFTTGMITLSKNTVIDLNGYTMSKSDGQRIVSFNGATDVTLTVTDSSAAKTGAMVVSGSKTNQGGLVWLCGTNNKLNLVAGTFDASGYTVSASGGGRSGAGIDANSSSEVNIYEGVTLKGGTVKHGGTTNNAVGGAIYAGGKLNIHGGTISGGKAVSGGNIYGSGSSTITISGGTITGGTAVGEKVTVGEETKEVYGLGGNIRADGVLTITGGTIEKGAVVYGETGGWIAGGNLYVSKTVTISGGTITGGTSESQGGNIYSTGGGRITMTGGTITAGNAVYGGNLYLDKGAQFTMSKGTVDKGVASNFGGNFALVGASKLTVTGGKIENGQATNGGNIYMEANSGNNPTVDIQNITVSGGTASCGGNLYIKAGTASFTGATITGGTANNPTGYGQGGNLFTEGGTVNLNAGTTMNGGSLVNGNGQNWRPGANGYLNGGTVNIKGTVSSAGGGSQGHNFYVNGKTVVNVDGGKIECTGAEASNVYIRSGTLNIKNNGQVTSTGNNCRNIVTNDEAAQGQVNINLQSGKIIGGKNVTGNGGNINLTSKATMTISGGEITGGSCSDGGGNIANYGTLNITGGKIYGGQAATSNRNNIYSQGDVNISGGEVWGGLTMHNLGKANLTVSGAAVVNGKLNETAIPGITFWSYQTNPSKPLTISGKLTGTACIGINMSNWAFANAGDNTADSIKAFFADDTNQGIYLLDSTDSQAGMLYVGQYNCICGGTASKGACAEGGHAKVRWTPWNGTKDNMTSDGHYYLTTDANVGTQITIGSDGRPANVSVNLNGHSLTTTFRIFQLWKNGVLNVADHKGGGKLLTKGNTGDNYGIFQMVESGTTINLYSGYVGMAEGYTNHKDISIAGAGGTFNMYGGTIDGGENGANATSISIGGAGIFNLYGGTVKNGESVSGTDGGNFRVYGKLNIYGGTIENGKSAVQGGNMRVMSGGKVTMTGGTIQNGYATKQGGNVNIADGGFFELKGGKILGGIASESGGNVLVNGDLIVNGGSISGGKNGTADKSSASENSNLFAVNGNVTFKGGTVDGACIINTVNNGCIVKIEDDAVITNANGDGLELAQYGEGVIKPVAEIGVLEEGASIVVNGELNRVFGTGTGAIFDNKGYFSSNDGYTVICTEDGLMMIDATKTHAHCVCGGELAEDETHECVDVIYTAMTTSDHTFYSDDKYASFRGNYYLTDDLNMGGKSINLRHDAQINICLNGHKLTSSTRTVAMFCDGQDGSNCKHSGQTDFVATPVLNIASCEDGGVIASNSTNSENGRVLWARYGDINAYGITIDATKAVNNSGNGHTGIAVQTNTGNATLYNCTVKGGIDNSLSTDFKFGALLSCNGTGNLKLVGDLTLEVSDKAMGLLVLDKCKVDISRLESVNAPISVSASGVFTVGGNDTELKVEDVFTSFISGMDVFTSVNTEPGEAFFGKATCLCDSGTEAHLGECDGSRLELAAWRTSSYLPKTSGNYILLPGHSKTSLCIPADGAMINVNLNGQTVKGSDRIYAPLFVADTGYKCNSATINIVNGTLVSHTSGTQGGVLWMGNGAKVSLYDVTIDARGRNATGSGTVADVGSGAVLNLYGNSTLYGGTTTASGGTLSVAGKVNMWDDTQIIGGTVKKANADSKPVGGCVCISNANAVVTLNDNAVIKDGICEYNAGNIYIATGKLVMNDNAQILNGKAGNISGNVQVSSGQSLVINGGVISGGMTGYKLDTKTGNADTVSANVTALNNANLIMTGGHIAGHVNAFAYSNGASPKITLSGDAKISGGSVNLNMNVDAGSIFAITIGEGGLTEGAEIQINLDTEYVSGTTFVTGVSQADVKYITASQGFLYDNTELIIYVK